MALNIRIQIERFPIAGAFTISRGTKTVAEVIVCTLVDGDHSGRGYFPDSLIHDAKFSRAKNRLPTADPIVQQTVTLRSLFGNLITDHWLLLTYSLIQTVTPVPQIEQ